MAKSVAELKREHNAFIEEMKSIVTKDSNLTDDDKERLDNLEKCAEEHADRIERLESINQLAAKAGDDDDETPDENEELAFTPKLKTVSKSGLLIKNDGPKPEPGIRFARYVLASAAARSAMSRHAGVRFAQDQLGDKVVAKALLESDIYASGGSLVPQDFVAEIIPLLYARSVTRRAGARILPARNANLTIPRLRGGAQAYWIGETSAITPSQQQTDTVQFSAKKLAGFVAVTNDMIRRSAISVEALVRDDLVEQLALAEDYGFLLGSGSSGVPNGLVNQAGTALTTVSSFNLADTSNAIRSMELALLAANVPMESVCLIWHPSVRVALSTVTDSVGNFVYSKWLDNGNLFGYPYFESTQLPTNLGGSANETQIIMAAMNEVIIADTLDLQLDSSTDGTYVVGGVTTSAFQNDQMLFRAIREMDIQVRHPAAVCVNTVTGWFPTGFTTNAGAAYSTQSASTTPSAALSTQG